MPSTVTHPESSLGSPGAGAGPGQRLHRLAAGTAALAWAAAVLGGAVTSTDSALVDPAWPGFGGRILPDLGAMLEHPALLLEHGHRILIGVVGVLTVVFALRLRRSAAPPSARRLAVLAVVLWLAPAALGGLTVLLGKSSLLSVLHVSLATLLVAVWSALAVVTNPGWRRAGARPAAAGRPGESPGRAAGGEGDRAAARALRAFAGVTLGAVWLQIVLGAIPRHATQEAGGRNLVLIGDAIHILWAFVVFGAVVLLWLEIARRHRGMPRVERPGLGLMALVVLQFFLGLVTFVTQPSEPPSRAELRAATAVPAPAGASGGEAPEGMETGPRAADAAGRDGTRRTAGPDEDLHAVLASAHQATGLLMLIAATVLLTRSCGLAAGPDERRAERGEPGPEGGGA